MKTDTSLSISLSPTETYSFGGPRTVRTISFYLLMTSFYDLGCPEQIASVCIPHG